MEVFIFSGFLGSGKTTILLETVRAFLQKGMKRIQIIENDAGKIPIDSEIVRQLGLPVRDIFSGCICCSLKEEFMSVIEDIIHSNSCDILLIEPSGIAGSEALRGLFDNYPDIAVYSLLVADSSRLISPHRVPPFMRRSIELADNMILNKTDLLERQQQMESITDWLNKINPEIRVFTRSRDHKTAIKIPCDLIPQRKMRLTQTKFGIQSISSPEDNLSVLSGTGQLGKTNWPAAELKEQFNHMLEQFLTNLKKRGCYNIGHIKIFISGENDGFMIFQNTGNGDKFDLTEKWNGKQSIKDIRLNSLVYGINDIEHREILISSTNALCMFRLN